ncbi:PEP-CTERM sorting domain-containing protein [Methylomonas paludis]|uniref:PEP-CTERM sorting domain-containing protein n=1 Tax=Methylomonas paludis TaxID=1173101 RepID=UPI001FE24D52|nr:PEP-CTERM sorting domain-containing protein [Methylomonas paludis]
MNFSKSLLAVAILATAGSAQATLLNDGDAYLQVYDATNAQTYDLNLAAVAGLTLASLKTDTTIITVDLSQDSTWNAFKATLDTGNAVWGVGDSTKTDYQATTTGTGAIIPTGTLYSSAAFGVELLEGRVNSSLATSNSVVVADAVADQGGWAIAPGSSSTFANLFAGIPSANAGIAFGATGNFYDITGTTTGSGIHKTFTEHNNDLGTFSLSGNTLTFTPVAASAVPVPAAVWMFGTGLLGLLGLNRRKAV